MTDDEAKTKWCPFVRYSASSSSYPTANRWKQSAPPEEPHALNPVPCRCIAADCMAWRWCESAKAGADEHGFCGLAGKP